MAIYHLDFRIIGRAARAEKVPTLRAPNGKPGKSVVAAAAYRSGERLHDERQERDHDYSRTERVLHSEISLPSDAPDRFRDRETLWNEVESIEKRKDAQLAREVHFSIPKELNQEQAQTLVRDFVKEQFVDRGMAADWSIHAPGPKGDKRNIHAHVMLTTREITPDGFGQKNREWNSRELVQEVREQWANHANKALEMAGRSERIDHRSYEEQRREAIEKGDPEKYIEAAKVPKASLPIAAVKAHQRGEESEQWEKRQEYLKSPERRNDQAELRKAERHLIANMNGRDPAKKSEIVTTHFPNVNQESERRRHEERLQNDPKERARAEEISEQLREHKENLARIVAEREARERAEKGAKERAEREAGEQARAAEEARTAREQAERQAREKAEREAKREQHSKPPEQIRVEQTIEEIKNMPPGQQPSIAFKVSNALSEQRRKAIEKDVADTLKSRQEKINRAAAEKIEANFKVKQLQERKREITESLESKNPFNVLKRNQRREQLQELEKRLRPQIEKKNAAEAQYHALTDKKALSQDAAKRFDEKKPQIQEGIKQLNKAANEYFERDRQWRQTRERESGGREIER